MWGRSGIHTHGTKTVTHTVSDPLGASVAGDDGGFDVAAAVQHVTQNLLQARQWGLPGDVVGGANFLGRDQSEGPANRFRSVVEGGFQSDFGIMQAAGFELYLRPTG